MRRLLPLVIALGLAGVAAAQGAITDAAVRTFVARQEAAWNAGDLNAYFAGFTLGATFTDQAYVGDKPPVPYGTSSLADARAQTGKALARSKSRETAQVTRVVLAPDGRSAQVISRVATTLESPTGVRRLCASRIQTLITAGGQLRSRGRTDTFYKCPR